MSVPRLVKLRRECKVTLVPSGPEAVVSAGAEVRVVQELGGSFTVELARGWLARVDRADADALGAEPAGNTGQATAERPFHPDQVLDQPRTVFDPEIPVNIVDLGLVYRCETRPVDGGRHRVDIDLSMTAPGCGMGDVLRDEARAKVAAIPGVAEVTVELVWDPPWDITRMSEAARLELGMW